MPRDARYLTLACAGNGWRCYVHRARLRQRLLGGGLRFSELTSFCQYVALSPAGRYDTVRRRASTADMHGMVRTYACLVCVHPDFHVRACQSAAESVLSDEGHAVGSVQSAHPSR